MVPGRRWTHTYAYRPSWHAGMAFTGAPAMGSGTTHPLGHAAAVTYPPAGGMTGPHSVADGSAVVLPPGAIAPGIAGTEPIACGTPRRADGTPNGRVDA